MDLIPSCTKRLARRLPSWLVCYLIPSKRTPQYTVPRNMKFWYVKMVRNLAFYTKMRPTAPKAMQIMAITRQPHNHPRAGRPYPEPAGVSPRHLGPRILRAPVSGSMPKELRSIVGHPQSGKNCNGDVCELFLEPCGLHLSLCICALPVEELRSVFRLESTAFIGHLSDLA